MTDVKKPVERLVKVTVDADGKKHYRTIGNIYASRFENGAKLVTGGLFDALVSDGEKFEIFSVKEDVLDTFQEALAKNKENLAERVHMD